jgi:acetyl-CoA carboxylase biotin carboxyl carrier protein
MNIKDIKQLVKLMTENDLSELNIEEGESKIHLKRGGAESAVVPVAAAAAPVPSPAAGQPQAPAREEKPADDLVDIKSPMVGTFYAAQSPDGDPYVAVGSAVSEDTVVCIVEAMKVMNEIKAECSGTIADVCVRNTQPVEFGQVLFRVKP